MRRPPLPIHLMGAWTNSRLLGTATPFTQQNDGKWTFKGFVEGGVGGGGVGGGPPEGQHHPLEVSKSNLVRNYPGKWG